MIKADNLCQDYYRIIWRDKKCEGCGKPMELVHHFVLKSHSNKLRHEEINLIPICKICHAKVHGFHGSIINAQIILGRGKKWLNKIRELERDRIDLTMSKLNEIIEKYRNKIAVKKK